MDEKIENLIELIKLYDKKCPDCNNVFLGVAVDFSYYKEGAPRYMGLNSYPLKCDKCPKCAQDCFDNLFDYAKENGKIPCADSLVENYGDIDEFITDIKYQIDCTEYCDKENFESELIDLFERITSELNRRSEN